MGFTCQFFQSVFNDARKNPWHLQHNLRLINSFLEHFWWWRWDIINSYRMGNVKNDEKTQEWWKRHKLRLDRSLVEKKPWGDGWSRYEIPWRPKSSLMHGQLEGILITKPKLKDFTQSDFLIVQLITRVIILSTSHLVLERGYVLVYYLLYLTLSCHWQICWTILIGNFFMEWRKMT